MKNHNDKKSSSRIVSEMKKLSPLVYNLVSCAYEIDGVSVCSVWCMCISVNINICVNMCVFKMI